MNPKPRKNLRKQGAQWPYCKNKSTQTSGKRQRSDSKKHKYMKQNDMLKHKDMKQTDWMKQKDMIQKDWVINRQKGEKGNIQKDPSY